MDPVTVLQTVNGAMRLYSLVAEHREAQRWRDMTFAEADKVRQVCERGDLLVDIWPDGDGSAYVTVFDRHGSGRELQGETWDRWLEQRLATWEPIIQRLMTAGCAVEMMGLHGFVVNARSKQVAPGALTWATSACGHPASRFAPDGRCWDCEPQT